MRPTACDPQARHVATGIV